MTRLGWIECKYKQSYVALLQFSNPKLTSGSIFGTGLLEPTGRSSRLVPGNACGLRFPVAAAPRGKLHCTKYLEVKQKINSKKLKSSYILKFLRSDILNQHYLVIHVASKKSEVSYCVYKNQTNFLSTKIKKRAILWVGVECSS